MKLFLFVLFMSFFGVGLAQDKPAYTIYNKEGERVDYTSMLNKLSTGQIVLFGELHNNAIAHWLEFELAKDLSAKSQLILGAEMLEADNQDELNDYLKDKIDQQAFDSTARLWSNYDTDYAPLVNYAKDHKLSFIATNIPRRYASMVHKGGFESLNKLSKKEKKWIAPLPIPFDAELPRYKNILEMMGDHGSPELVKAQAIKDATMAHFIMANLKKKSLLLHFNGRYHSDYYEGVGWYLRQYGIEDGLYTVTTVEQEDILQLEKDHIGVADYIICVDIDMTKTY